MSRGTLRAALHSCHEIDRELSDPCNERDNSHNVVRLDLCFGSTMAKIRVRHKREGLYAVFEGTRVYAGMVGWGLPLDMSADVSAALLDMSTRRRQKLVY